MLWIMQFSARIQAGNYVLDAAKMEKSTLRHIETSVGCGEIMIEHQIINFPNTILSHSNRAAKIGDHLIDFSKLVEQKCGRGTHQIEVCQHFLFFRNFQHDLKKYLSRLLIFSAGVLSESDFHAGESQNLGRYVYWFK